MNKLWKYLNQEAVIIGDLNLPVLKWGDPISSHAGQDLYMDLQESSLNEFVHSPPRGNNLFDLVLATSEDLVENQKVGDVFSNSDHRIITFSIKFNCCKQNSSNKLVANYKKANFCKFKSILKETDWRNTNSSDTKGSWNAFLNTYTKAVKECIPMRRKRPDTNNKPKMVE